LPMIFLAPRKKTYFWFSFKTNKIQIKWDC
jgi:hypothetical protein